jgi:NAD(P)-dependent dehydrogenase (short-subunit alcohol dehydrogenase family)
MQHKRIALVIGGNHGVGLQVAKELVANGVTASSWKSKGGARRIVKDKGSGLFKPIETELTRAKNWKILMRRNSDRPACVATRQRQAAEIISPTR